MGHHTLLPVLGSLALAACAASANTPALANDEPARTITVGGAGEASGAPDLATVNIGVKTEGSSASEALRTNAAAMQKTIDRLKSLSIEAKDIQTSGLSVNPQYDYQQNRNKPRITGYVANNNVTVRLRDIAKAGDVIDQAVSSGANSLGGIRFGFADPKPLLEAARRDAVADAKSRARVLTDAAGVRLGELIIIQDGHSVTPGPRPVVQARARLESDSFAASPVEVGESTIRAQVTLVYTIE